MRTMKRNRCSGALAATVLGVCVMGTVANAAEYDVTTEQSGSILVFPKVIWDGPGGSGARDTVIQIANTSNMPVMAHCFYVDGEDCGETDFYLYLTRQHPTNWVVSSGRVVSWTGSGGIAPGHVPPVPPGFRGQLMCVQVDPNDQEPLRADQLKGEAVLRDATGDVSKYNAIAFRGNDGPGVTESANPFDLDLNWTAQNANGQYSSCPSELRVGHATGAPEFSKTHALTEFTVVPCYADLENQTFAKTKVKFNIIDEYETELSLNPQSVGCWLNIDLATLLGKISIATPGAQMIIESVQDAGVVGVVEEYRTANNRPTAPSGHAASAMIGVGNRAATTAWVDQFILPQP